MEVPSTITRGTLDIFDVAGRLVRSVWHGRASDATASITWDGFDEKGREAPDGIYFARLATSEWEITERIVLVR